MIKLNTILEELKPPSPEKIYEPGFEPGKDFPNLTAAQEKELLSKGQILVPIKDPTRTSASEVIRLPRIKDMKRTVKEYSSDLKIFKSASNDKIKMLGEELTSQLNYIERLLKALDIVLEKQKKGIDD